MAKVGNPRIKSLGDSQGVYTFIVSYDAVFEPFEAGLAFEEAAAIWERDPSDNDRIRDYDIPRQFQAPNLVAGQVASVHREFSLPASKERLNTEVGDEQIMGRVWLRRVGAGPADDERFTPFITVNP